MSTEVDFGTASGKIFAVGAAMMALGGLLIVSLLMVVGLVAAGIIS